MINTLSLQETAQILKKSVITVRRYIRNGQLRAKVIITSKGRELRIFKQSIDQLMSKSDNNSKVILSYDHLNHQEAFISVKDLLSRYDQMVFRVAQLENQRLMLTERAESLQEKEKEYQTQIQKLKNQLEEKQRIIENLTRKKWWEFWKKPISQLSEPSSVLF